MYKINLVKEALALQCLGSLSDIEIEINFQGKKRTLRGKRSSIMELGPQVVILLTDDSTPQKRNISEKAESDFMSAASQLLEGGKRFYTELRPMWNLPVFVWTAA